MTLIKKALAAWPGAFECTDAVHNSCGTCSRPIVLATQFVFSGSHSNEGTSMDDFSTIIWAQIEIVHGRHFTCFDSVLVNVCWYFMHVSSEATPFSVSDPDFWNVLFHYCLDVLFFHSIDTWFNDPWDHWCIGCMCDRIGSCCCDASSSEFWAVGVGCGTTHWREQLPGLRATYAQSANVK